MPTRYALFQRRWPVNLRVELTVNPSFRLQSGSAFPEEVRHFAVPAHGFLKHYPIAWVADAGMRVWMPYWGRGGRRLLEQLRPGGPRPGGLVAYRAPHAAAGRDSGAARLERQVRALDSSLVTRARPVMFLPQATPSVRQILAALACERAAALLPGHLGAGQSPSGTAWFPSLRPIQ